ncbi:Hypothetical predicted protein [Paramuricea clavata]|uniref:Uncharacterized protein n=2 Tax=Paramuricea clavata TaxID=317549 RepID=A0A6S7I2X8_PARCT|nr:Hypothetical predicted protein [Paramuricea clavata]
MSTETHARYHAMPNMQINTSRKTVGRKEGSGFTHAYNDEPITHRPKDAYDSSYQLISLSRPTGMSVMKTSFLPSVFCDGKERLPILPRNAERTTGFTREAMGKPAFYLPNKEKVFTELNDIPSLVQDRIKKEHPTEYLNLTNPNNKSSITSKTFTGLQQNHPSLAQRLANSNIGSKELTGFTENNCQYVEHFETPETLSRFKTHYDSQFQDRNPTGEARLGRTAGHVMPLPLDGFTKSTKVDNFGPQFNTTKQIQNLQPYVARSIKARDPLFDDHTHDTKFHVIKEMHT